MKISVQSVMNVIAKETLGGQLISFHNIRFLNKMMEDIRNAIENDNINEVEKEYCNN